jgi:carboxymethylenebutenolidase
MRSTLPSGTVISINTSQAAPVGGLVIIPDIFGVRPLFDDMVDRFAREWNMHVVAVEPFPGLNLGPEVEPRRAAVTNLDDDKHLADLEAAADMLGVAHVGLMGFCMGGMYCFNSVRSAKFAKIASRFRPRCGATGTPCRRCTRCVRCCASVVDARELTT